MKTKKEYRIKRKKSIRKNLSGSSDRPRLTVYRSNKHLFAQVIDDVNMTTLCSVSDIKSKSNSNIESAKALGTSLSKLLKNLKVDKVVFDRNGYRYHGRVKSLAEAVRSEGINF